MIVLGSGTQRSKSRMVTASSCFRHATYRRRRGAAMAEFAPALFLLFFFALFPAVDIIGAGVGYSACLSLNDLQLREASKIPKSQAIDPRGPIQLIIPNNWRPTVMGGLAGLIDDPLTEVEYVNEPVGVYVVVSTTCTIHPLFQIPFFPGVPALGAPYITKVSRRRVLENPAFEGQ